MYKQLAHFTITLIRVGTHNSLSSSDHEGGSTPIRSPIRVSPSHKEPRLVREAHSSKYSRSDSSKLSVKERLYVSKRTIGMLRIIGIALLGFPCCHLLISTNRRKETHDSVSR